MLRPQATLPKFPFPKTLQKTLSSLPILSNSDMFMWPTGVLGSTPCRPPPMSLTYSSTDSDVMQPAPFIFVTVHHHDTVVLTTQLGIEVQPYLLTQGVHAHRREQPIRGHGHDGGAHLQWGSGGLPSAHSSIAHLTLTGYS